MILKMQLCLVLMVVWVNKAACASVSKVYLQSGSEALPLEYYQYGAPGLAYASPQIAQLSAAPVNSMVPVSSGYVSPCVAPCVYPSPTIASFAPVPSNANLVSYQSPVPSLPVVTNNWNDPTGYKYEYVVYDQTTGDKKLQSEFSDGSIVRGEYSFLQPDGYVREVQYVADDLRGFNAVVTNYLPITEEETKIETTGETKPATPCPQVKSEQLKHIESVSETKTSDEEKHALSDGLESATNHKHTHESHLEGGPTYPHKSHGEASEKSEDKVHEGSQENVLTVSHGTHNIPAKEVISKEVHNTSTKEGQETKISTIQKTTKPPSDASILVPYKEIMKCIESLLNKATMVQTESPLAYIVLNKPC